MDGESKISTNQTKIPHIAAILPTYNEGGRISAVLDVLREVGHLSEIIVVDDGSSDNTSEHVMESAKFDQRIRLLRHPCNLGKGQAIFTAWRNTQATYLLLLDSDLINLKPGHVWSLIEPVINNNADMTLGLFWGGKIYTDFAHWATPWLTGQRCLCSEILFLVSEEAARGYGFEIAVSVTAQKYGYRIRLVPLKGVWHPPSEFHRGWLPGIPWRIRMYKEIVRAWWLVRTTARNSIQDRKPSSEID